MDKLRIFGSAQMESEMRSIDEGRLFKRVVTAAVLYFLIVFSAGFFLGVIRVSLLEPWLGETVAVSCEAPFMLLAIALTARWLPLRLCLTNRSGSLAAMGAGALLLLQISDITLGLLLRGRAPSQLLHYFATPAGQIYGALLIAFAAMPVLVNRRREVLR
jgi:hypothetical protein